MQKLPSGTVTFLFTDIEGSTKLWQDYPDAMRPALARHDVLLWEAMTQNGGFVFKTVGDAFYSAFATAPEAMRAALAAQVALAAEPWATETPLRIRMALHTGSAEERDGDYYGPPLNRVVRLLAAGHGGQVLISAATQELVRDQLPADATLRNLGDASLRDLTRPERVFQFLHPLLPADFPPLRSLDNPNLPNNLPQQPTSFIGREREMAEVKALLDKTRLLTLTGGGGSGKTRLSLQVAADLLDGKGDGVWLVELASLSDPALVPQAVADVLGVREEGGKRISSTLIEWLKTKRLLLVLDNCEHLVAACASLAADLIRSCPGVHLLASSREPLGVAGEQTYRVPSLSLPDPNQVQTVESLSQYEAVRLFIERARTVQPNFAVTNQNAPAVAQVCYHLDGIPLAIELAAARVRSLSVEEINARLGNRFRLLTGGARNTLPRQQTLRALIDWSYDLLTGQEKALLCRLSVFAGGWTLAAAESVCVGEDMASGRTEDFEVLDLLTSLVDKSLVSYEERAGQARYGLLETIRQYAHGRLAEGTQMNLLRERHAHFYLALAEEVNSPLGQTEGLERLVTEMDNLRAALERFAAEGSDAEAGIRLIEFSHALWGHYGHLSEARAWLSRLLQLGPEDADVRGQALQRAGAFALIQADYTSARTLFEEALTLQREKGLTERIGGTLANLGKTAFLLGNAAEARSLFEEALAIGRDEGNTDTVIDVLKRLGDVDQFHERDFAAARVRYEEALAVAQKSGDEWRIFDVLEMLANVDFNDGRYESSRVSIEAILAWQRARQDREGVASSLRCLGDLARVQKDAEAAHAFYEESKSAYRELHNKGGIGGVLNSQGLLADQEGNFARALTLYEEMLEIFQERGEHGWVAMAFEHMGGFAERQQDYPAARSYYEHGLATRREIGNNRKVADTLMLLSNLALLQGSGAEARRLGEESLALYRGVTDERSVATRLADLGNIAMAESDLVAARTFFEESLAIRRELGNAADIAYSLTDLGNVTAKEGDLEAAHALYQQSLGIWQESGDARGTAFTLVGLMRVASARQQTERAALFDGAVTALSEGVRSPQLPWEQEDYDRCVAVVRVSLGDEAFAAAWDAGRAMTLEEAVEYALSAA